VRRLKGRHLGEVPPFSIPESGFARVVRILTVVDLPAPFGPRSPKTVPGSTVTSMPFRAMTSPG
jgi:hypothetical protein